MNRPYSEATAAMIAEAMHKALDAVDEGWHLSCMDPDGDGSCAKGHYARRMLVEDVAPAVLDALTKAGLLLPEEVETRTEWAWAHDIRGERCLHTVPCEEDAQKVAGYFDDIRRIHLMRRQMLIGPWESVDAVRLAEGDPVPEEA